MAPRFWDIVIVDGVLFCHNNRPGRSRVSSKVVAPGVSGSDGQREGARGVRGRKIQLKGPA